MKLADFQAGFAGQLIGDPESCPPDVSGPFPAQQLLQIYRNNFVFSLTDYLEACYPVTLALVGSTFFEQLARQFIIQQPLTQAPLENYGQAFPTFIAACPQAQSLPYLSDIAELEWQLDRVNRLSATDRFPFTALTSLTPEQQQQLRLLPSDSIGVLHSPYAVLSIWQGVNDGNLEDIDINQPQRLLIYPSQTPALRADHIKQSEHTACAIARITPLNDAQWQLFNALTQNTSMDQLNLTEAKQQQLNEWISCGVIINFTLESTHD